MSDLLAITAARIFDGFEWHEDAALLVEFGHVIGIVEQSSIPEHSEVVHLDGGFLVPGFVDLQVNGGGGVLFNNDPSVSAIYTICAAHARFGTTALLPTLITDTVEVNLAAMRAGREAAQLAVPGFLGLHLEGPHLSVARKGTHDPSLIRPMNETDLSRLLALRNDLPNLLVTVAPETVTPAQISVLAEAGIVVSLGHSDAGHEVSAAAFEAGATMATHLFNAMSQLANREPGLVGATLVSDDVHAGLIADGIHVHPAAIQIALRAKNGRGRLFLVTDAMSQTGTDLTKLQLNGRTITRSNGALRLSDGTLAGADLDMIKAVRFLVDRIGVPLVEALRMASLYPAEAMGVQAEFGHLRPGAVASFVHLTGQHEIASTWIAGQRVFSAA
jgi:N-acetylglucosamine-6-phosphate deacetylase